MIEDLDDDGLMRRFLLGAASPEERDLIEARFMTDGDYFEKLSALECEMGLDELRGRTPPHEQALFKTAVLAVAGRRRVMDDLALFTAELDRMQRAVDHGATTNAAPTRATSSADAPWWQRFADAVHSPGRQQQSWALPGAALAILAVTVILIRAPSSVPQLADSTPPQSSNLPANGASGPQPVVATLVLAPGATRAALRQANLFQRPIDADEIDLVTTVPNALATEVGAIIKRVGGSSLPLTSAAIVRTVTNGIEVHVRVAARVLPRGDYLLSLVRLGDGAGAEPFATRFFTVDE